MNHHSKYINRKYISLCNLFNLGCIFLFSSQSSVIAQVVPDDSLGNENSIVNSVEEQVQNIEGGAIRGINLFHSFSEFNIPESNSVYFINPDNISNIIGRVTGNNSSQILGTLGVLGEANLFLINPNGILFGENASLDLRGSFISSTANSVIFSNGQEFSAINPEAPPLLVINMPIGLGFIGTPQSIVSEAELFVDPGQTLAFIGGEISLTSGGLIAEGGNIELGSVADSSVQIVTTNRGFKFSYQDVNNFLDVSLLNTAFIDTSGEGAGDITIQAKNFTVTDDAGIFATTFGSKDGGTISLTASDSVKFNGFSVLFSATEGEGSAPDINIKTKTFILSEGATIASDVCFDLGDCATGNGGKINITTSELVDISGVGLSTSTEASGNAGNITIQTKQLTLTDGANIASFSSTESDGKAGDVNVEASELVDISGAIETEEGLFFSGIGSNANSGDGGNVNIKTSNLKIEDGAFIVSTTFGTGNAGNISIEASESVEIIGTAGEADFLSGIFAQVAFDALDDAGDAGNITINTERLIIRDGAQIANTARFGGNGGELTINATEFILLEGTAPDATPLKGSSGIFVSADPVEDSGDLISPTADAGTLNITTGTLTVEDGAKISADNFGSGEGGDATLTVDNLIIQNGGLVRAGSFGEGSGGTLTVEATESIEISGTGTIGDNTVKSSLFTQAEGTGDAGDLSITTSSLTIKDGGEITAQTRSTQGGNIRIDAGNILRFEEDGRITTSAGTAQAGGDGGDITVDADFIVAFPTDNTYDIIAQAFEGDGGNIDIATNSIFGSEFLNIDASSEFGLSGEIAIETPNVDPIQGLINLPTEVVDASQLISQRCLSGDDTANSSSEFIVTGKGGLPPSPNETLTGEAVLPAEWLTVDGSTTENNSNIMSKKESETPAVNLPEIIQASGWVRRANGKITLVANNTPTNASDSALNYPQCPNVSRR